MTEPSSTTETGLGVGTYLTGSLGLLASLSTGQVAEWIERIGLPTALLLGCAWIVVRAGRWLGENAIRPLVARQVATLDTVQETAKSQARALERVADSMASIAESEGKTLACVERLEAAANEERKTTRLAISGLQKAVDSLDRAARGETPGPVDPR